MDVYKLKVRTAIKYELKKNLEDTWLLGEWVDALAGGLGLHGFDGELGKAGKNEQTTLLHLEGADAAHGAHGELSFLALEAGQTHHVVDEFALGHVLALGCGDGAGHDVIC